MALSEDEFSTGGERSPPACSVRSDWGLLWVRIPAWEVECFWLVWTEVHSSSRHLPSGRHAAQRNRRRNCWCICLRTAPAGSISGSKRGIRETSLCHSIERLFCPCHKEGPSKKLRHIGYQIHDNLHRAGSSDSNIRESRPKSVGNDFDDPKTTKSCEGNSQDLHFRSMSVMRPPSDLYSLLGYGGRNSFASANVRTPCAALGLGLNCCFRVREQSVSAEASSVEVIRKKATSIGWDSVPNDYRERIAGLPEVCRFWKRQQSVPSETISVGLNSKKPSTTTCDSLPYDCREHIVGLRKVRRFRERQQSVPSETISKPGLNSRKPSTTTWDSLPNDLQENVLQRVDFRDLFHFKGVSKDWRKFIEGEAFRQSRGGISEGEFTAINYYIKNKSWRCSAYDLHSRSWKSFPPVSYLPPPDAELFKEYSVCGHGGLMCAEVSKLPKKGELVVFNPLTGETRALPPLLHPRNPVLVHLSVDSAKKSYKVIVAGSSAASDEHLSKKVEVFNSLTSTWKEACDLPGPAFGLNEHQAGVFLNGKLFLISFLESGGRGVVAFDVENGTWLQDLTTPIPWSSYSNTLQLVESDGKLFLFSEQEPDQSVNHCIDELEFPNHKAGVCTRRWRNVVKAKKSGGRGLQVYPENTCVGFGEGKLCIFNTLSRDGVVYDMRDGKKCEDLVPPPANQMGDNFFSLNPASFTLQPNFAIKC